LQRLALFPLQLVLFPGLSLDLQIFEQRYIRLVSETLKTGNPFGIVPIIEDPEVDGSTSFFANGTSVQITDWDQLDNGLLGVRVEGLRRFEVVGTEVDQDNLILADVNWLETEPDVELGEDYLGLQELLTDLAKHPGAATFRLNPDTRNASELGFQLAQVLPLEDEQKLELLCMRNPIERLELLSDLVENLSQQ
jgi:Lon protease-like protein